MGRSFIFLNLYAICLVLVIVTWVESKPHRRRYRRPLCVDYDEYFNKTTRRCEPCATCAAGLGVKSYCKVISPFSDTECEECIPEVTYSTSRSSATSPCYPCTQCGGRSVKYQCTPKSDTVCGECPQGKYWDEVDYRCKQCSPCSASLWPERESACMGENMNDDNQCREPYGVVGVKTPELRKLFHADNGIKFHTLESDDVITQYTIIETTKNVEPTTSSGDLSSDDVIIDDVFSDAEELVGTENLEEWDFPETEKSNNIGLSIHALIVLCVSIVLFIILIIIVSFACKATVTSQKSDYEQLSGPGVTCPKNERSNKI
ncbi:uncharacterized protein LOC100183229 [Ciona intestinalis]